MDTLAALHTHIRDTKRELQDSLNDEFRRSTRVECVGYVIQRVDGDRLGDGDTFYPTNLPSSDWAPTKKSLEEMIDAMYARYKDEMDQYTCEVWMCLGGYIEDSTAFRGWAPITGADDSVRIAVIYPDMALEAFIAQEVNRHMGQLPMRASKKEWFDACSRVAKVIVNEINERA